MFTEILFIEPPIGKVKTKFTNSIAWWKFYAFGNGIRVPNYVVSISNPRGASLLEPLHPHYMSLHWHHEASTQNEYKCYKPSWIKSNIYSISYQTFLTQLPHDKLLYTFDFHCMMLSSTLICGIRWPDIILSKFHTILNIYYQLKKIQLSCYYSASYVDEQRKL